MKIAIVGATGLVGSVMLEVLSASNLPFSEMIPVASSKSIGKLVQFGDRQVPVQSMENALKAKPDVALFSAGSSTSVEMAPKFAEIGTVVIDNSSAWRMHEDVKLVVPEVNGSVLTSKDKIIANPNCSTIQMVMALHPLHAAFEIKRLVISTYQSFTGTGSKAVAQYENERDHGTAQDPAYPHPIFANCLPHCDVFLKNGYTKEEMKLVHETHKIMGASDISITATAVRVPVFGGHSESINIEFNQPYQIREVVELLNNMPGVLVMDEPEKNVYPTALQAHNRDEVMVGRIRRDESIENGLNLWVVSDNLRKGAATNAVQILQYLHENNLMTMVSGMN